MRVNVTVTVDPVPQSSLPTRRTRVNLHDPAGNPADKEGTSRIRTMLGSNCLLADLDPLRVTVTHVTTSMFPKCLGVIR